MLKVIAERDWQALDKNVETQSVALAISKAFDKVWHVDLQTLNGYGFSG